MLVELDIWSGRPNPRWELDASSVERLRVAQAGLEPAGGPPPEPPGLGYRGFRYVLDGGEWRAFAGTVSGPEGALRDPDRRIERQLLETLPVADQDLRARVASMIDQSE